MYTQHYGFTARPFQLNPDPGFYFGSRGHSKALAYLSFGLSEREGFIVITGEVGAGKTTLVGYLMNQIDRSQYVSASIVTTQLGADDALRMVASAFRLPIEGKEKATLLRDIEANFTATQAEGKHVLLIVDESQNLSLAALEELRMLSNFQADGKPLVQCFLLGQPQFRTMMARPEMEQLRQRVIASCHLDPLKEDETRSYIEHRLAHVGWKNDPAFTDEAFRLIHSHTGGVPRRINTMAGRLLLYGFLEDKHVFDEDVVAEVVRELSEEGTQISARDAALHAVGPGGGGTAQNSAAALPDIGALPDRPSRARREAAPLPEDYDAVVDILDRRIAELGGAG